MRGHKQARGSTSRNARGTSKQEDQLHGKRGHKQARGSTSRNARGQPHKKRGHKQSERINFTEREGTCRGRREHEDQLDGHPIALTRGKPRKNAAKESTHRAKTTGGARTPCTNLSFLSTHTQTHCTHTTLNPLGNFDFWVPALIDRLPTARSIEMPSSSLRSCTLPRWQSPTGRPSALADGSPVGTRRRETRRLPTALPSWHSQVWV